jgi:hypothetical protein
MKQEKIFHALNDVGDDLVMMAQTMRFVNPWKRWGKLAACIALVLCLGVFALPYFPMGCGAAKETAPAEIPAECPAETPAETPAEAPAEEPAEAPTETEEEKFSPEEENQETENIDEVVTVWVSDVSYEICGQVEAPADLGEVIGTVQASDGRDLTGCTVYEAAEDGTIYIQMEETVYLCAKQAEYQSPVPD